MLKHEPKKSTRQGSKIQNETDQLDQLKPKAVKRRSATITKSKVKSEDQVYRQMVAHAQKLNRDHLRARIQYHAQTAILQN
jgi:hypothetical protein